MMRPITLTFNSAIEVEVDGAMEDEVEKENSKKNHASAWKII